MIVRIVVFFAYVVTFLIGLYFLMADKQDSKLGSLTLGMILVAPPVAKLLNGAWRKVTGRAS